MVTKSAVDTTVRRSSMRVARFFRSPQWWGMTSEEVAAEMGIEATNWRKSLSRATHTLRERFTTA